MSITIRGWNDIPEGYVQEEDFHLGPLWLRFLARIKIIERLAYPIAIKKGFGKTLANLIQIRMIQSPFGRTGLKYLGGEFPGFANGGSFEFDMKTTKYRFPVFALRLFTIGLFAKAVISGILGGYFSTRWGSNRKTEHMKQKIASSKSKLIGIPLYKFFRE
jgi:hypothetical protein